VTPAVRAVADVTAGRPFQSAVEFYVRYRSRYPATLLDAVAEAVGLDGRGRLLDLGCGPGFLAIGLASRFTEVVAMDPEPAMLAAADEAARAAGARLTLVLGGSENLEPRLGPFRLVTMGRAFHWMDRDRTLVALDTLVAAEGAVALFDVDHPQVPENAWRAAWEAVRGRYTPATRRPRWSEERHEAVLARSAFRAVRRLSHVWRQRTPIDALVGRALSMSSTTPEVLGEARPALEAELRAALGPFAEGGLVEEVLKADALVATWP
jgi:SAM-dependent methyltransferase